MLTVLTQSRIKAAHAFWLSKVSACNAKALTCPDRDEKSALIALAGRYAEGFLHEVTTLLDKDEATR